MQFVHPSCSAQQREASRIDVRFNLGSFYVKKSALELPAGFKRTVKYKGDAARVWSDLKVAVGWVS